MVLPAPVLPTIAVVCPGRAVKEMSCSTGCSAPGIAELDVPQLNRLGSGPAGRGLAGAATPGSVSRTSWIRPR